MCFFPKNVKTYDLNHMENQKINEVCNYLLRRNPKEDGEMKTKGCYILNTFNSKYYTYTI